jgi:hypothetical protein
MAHDIWEGMPKIFSKYLERDSAQRGQHRSVLLKVIFEFLQL